MSSFKKNNRKALVLFLVSSLFFKGYSQKLIESEDSNKSKISLLRTGFLSPPDSARPGVYWYFMDGNLSKDGMTADLESMKKTGIGNVIFLEVNVGIPRGD